MTDELTCAIGDVHGCRDKLDRVLARCADYADGRPTRFVFLGDYIDRGPDSRGVVATVMEMQARQPDRVVCLRGNHEAIMLEALASGDMTQWFINGCGATLESYGVATVSELPREHLAWYASLKLSFDDGRRYFVHAGVDPNRPLSEQSERDLLWIREPFLSQEHDYGRLIVHGHTPQRTGRPDLRSWRLNLDTAAVYGGRLTAAFFNHAQTGPIAFFNDES